MWGNWSQHVSYLSCSRFNVPRVTWGLLSGSVGFLIGNVSPKLHQNPKSPCSLQNRFTPRRTIGYEIGRCSLHSVSLRAHDGALFAQVPVARNDATRAPKSSEICSKPRPIYAWSRSNVVPASLSGLAWSGREDRRVGLPGPRCRPATAL